MHLNYNNLSIIDDQQGDSNLNITSYELPIYKKGSSLIAKHRDKSKIHIKKKNRGKFTEYCGGEVTDECIQRGKRSKSPVIRKRTTFAQNARKWSKHEDGGTFNGELNEKQRTTLQRSAQGTTASNYSDAVDLDISKARENYTIGSDRLSVALKDYPRVAGIIRRGFNLVGKDYTKGDKLPTGLQNCTLTATGWICPEAPIGNANTILNDGLNYGYVQIPQEYALPGDLVIASNPDTGANHSMLLANLTSQPTTMTFYGDTYNIPEDHPIMRYSNGSTDPSGYRGYVPLAGYLANSGGKTQVNYYRHLDPGTGEVLLPPIEVTPQGNIIAGDTSIHIMR